ncbi:hypothetical protein [Bacteroides sp.]|uniref:hypothetical protein n=1 Tax=Bacteroides sp. TaxID=29523 RepID=UPI0025BBBABA|nr:hypothetical protein [Bacteroides sp.]
MKNLFYALFIVLFISSCSETDSNSPEPEAGNKIIPFDLNAEKEINNIFELTVFKLSLNDPINDLSLESVYDSITWQVSNLNGRKKIYEHTEYSNKFVHQWSHNFHTPGTYKTYISCYKDNKVIHSRILDIEIINRKDFLCYNWNDIKNTATHATGYVDALCDEYSFATFVRMHQETPSVSLTLYNEKDNDDPTFSEKSQMVLTDHITSLYSTPTYNTTNENVTEKYNELFAYKNKKTEPQCIWITPTSKIVLLKHNTGYSKYEIYAEPN